MNSTIERTARLLEPLVRRDVPLGPLTTYRVGGMAHLFARAGSEADLRRIGEALSNAPVPILVLGRGSNLLVGERGFEGLVVSLGGSFEGVGLSDPSGGLVRAGAAVSLPVLARRTAAAGLTGLEWAVGVPGSVGGAIRMNAGGHGAETSDVLERAGLTDLSGGPTAELAATSLGYSYRHSSVTASQVVRWGEFRVEKGDAEQSAQMISEIVSWRREHQPGGQNAGSVFTNPPGDSAGRLVDVAGLKGHRIGSAQVSTKHANFIQADPGGSADDVIALIEDVQETVAERLGVWLELEVQVVGDRESRYKAQVDR
jgi:UDP-N-acetylmuramate dehydrogenase